MATSSVPNDSEPRREPVSVLFGLLIGGVSGPLLAYVLMLSPDSELLGPFPPHADRVALWSGMYGALLGPPVGLVITLLFKLVQRGCELCCQRAHVDKPAPTDEGQVASSGAP
jgi:hypothetical protein